MAKATVSSFAVLLILSLYLSLSGCKRSAPEAPRQASSSAESATTTESARPAARVERKAPARPQLLTEGQTAVCEDVEITLLGTRKATEYTKTPDQGKGYVVLRFRVKNTGDEEMYGDISSDLQWRTAQSDRREGYERTTGVRLDNPQESDLAPGKEAEFEAVYMMPNDTTEVEFHYVPGYNPIEKARWNIKIQ